MRRRFELKIQSGPFYINQEDIELRSELGEGGFGTVYQGIWQDDVVAIKGLKLTQLTDKLLKSFAYEASIIASLHSPRIVTFYGITQEKPYYLVMEFMSQGSLHAYLHREGVTQKSLTWDRRLLIASDIAKGLNYLHKYNIVHGDLKSLNVLLDDQYRAKLADFGLASIKESTASLEYISSRTFTEAKGTLLWLAPELLEPRAKKTSQSDLYSFGMTLWELYSLEVPFKGVHGGISVIINRIIEGKCEEFTITNGIPEGYQLLVTQSWDGDPEKRPTAKQAIEQLKRIVEVNPPAQERNRNSSHRTFHVNQDDIELGSELGEGGFGTVYQGTWQGDVVAIKQLKLTDKLLKSFEHEASIIASLHSPRIVTFYGITREKPYYLVMEFMSQGSLYGYLHRQGVTQKSLTWDRRLLIASDIAKGLNYLHSCRIVHGDLKSLNVLLDGQYRAKLADFGLAKIKTETERLGSTSSGAFTETKGSLLWLAPELFERKAKKTFQSDLYSFGMTLWELSSLKFPFKGFHGGFGTIKDWVIKGGREEFTNETPKDYQLLVTQSWDGDPKKRPTVKQAIEQLKRIVEANPSAQETHSSHRTPPAATAAQNDSPNPNPSPSPQADPNSTRSHGENASRFGVFSTPPPKSQVSQEQLDQLLKLVAEGCQSEAEKLVKANPTLLLHKGAVTDFSDRTFHNITAFQYALWALDWHMWSMLRRYLPITEQRAQLNELEEEGTEHGKQFDFNSILIAYQELLDRWGDWGTDEKDQYWCGIIGAQQKLFPAHVVNEFCRPDRSLHPVPDFLKESSAPRIVKGDQGHWWQTTYRGGLGEKPGFAWYRGGRLHNWWQWGPIAKIEADINLNTGSETSLPLATEGRDLQAVRALSSARSQQWLDLKQECLEGGFEFNS